MEDSTKYQKIIEKISNGLKFGLFEDGNKCYFQDGEQVSYNDLWKALRMKYELDGSHKKTIPQLCPESFIGVVPHKFSKIRWGYMQLMKSYFSV